MKKLLLFLLVFSVTLLMSGCSKKESASNDSKDKTEKKSEDKKDKDCHGHPIYKGEDCDKCLWRNTIEE